jgi:hypothetical protein
MYAGGFEYRTEISLTLPKANMAIRYAYSVTVFVKSLFIYQKSIMRITNLEE